MELTDYGFASWMDLYRYMDRNGLADVDRVALTGKNSDPDIKSYGPQAVEKNDMLLWVQEIRAKAFAEVYEQLPIIETLTVVQDMLRAAKFKNPHDREIILSFISKIPTK